MALLSVSVLGLGLAIPVAVQSQMRNRVDAEGVLLVQQELEQMLAQSLATASFVDNAGNTVTISAGGATLANGKINFSAAAVAGYNATLIGTSGARYSVRWNVQSLGDGSKQFTIGAKRAGNLSQLLPPVNVVARRGAR